MQNRLILGLVLGGLMLGQPALLSAQDAPVRTEAVQFDAGSTGTSLSGSVTGQDYVT